MSTDEKVTKDLLQTCKDGSAGFTHAAEKLESDGQQDLATQFRGYATERDGFVDELNALAQQYGDDADKSGSVAGALHRGWITVKDAVTGSNDAAGVLKAAEQGEDRAESEYQKALKDDLSPTLREVVQRQHDAVVKVHQAVTQLSNAANA